MHYPMNDDDNRLPVRLRGQIESTKMVLRFAKQMTKSLDPGLCLGFAEEVLEKEAKLEHLRAEGRRLLTDKPEAALAGSH